MHQIKIVLTKKASIFFFVILVALSNTVIPISHLCCHEELKGLCDEEKTCEDECCILTKKVISVDSDYVVAPVPWDKVEIAIFGNFQSFFGITTSVTSRFFPATFYKNEVNTHGKKRVQAVLCNFTFYG